MCHGKSFNVILSFTVLFCVVLLTKSCQCRRQSGRDEQQHGDDRAVNDLDNRLHKLVNQWGFELTTYNATSKDGYYLKLHRLGQPQRNLKQPVFIMHGVMACSTDFLANRKSIAFYLAKRDYDVWVGNARGTAFSMKHKLWKPSNKLFWNYSFHEIGNFDVPVFLETIKRETGAKTVHYVGFSMGTTMFLALAVTQAPLVREDVASVSLIAPVACPRHFTDIKSKTKRIFLTAVIKLLRILRRGDFYTYHKNLAIFLYKLCKSKAFGRLCEMFRRKQSSGKDMYDHEAALDVIPFFPCGSSLKSLLHFIQLAKAGKFQRFDYGRRGNIKVYGQKNPPEYNLGAIDKKIYLLMGGEDVHADPRDVLWLDARLPNSVLVSSKLHHFDHRDFLSATDIDSSHEIVLGVIEDYEKDLRELSAFNAPKL